MKKRKSGFKIILMVVLTLLIFQICIGLVVAFLNEDICLNKGGKILSFKNDFKFYEIFSYNVTDIGEAIKNQMYEISIESDENRVYTDLCKIFC